MSSSETNIIEQIREDIIADNNTAQISFDNLLKGYNQDIDELHLPFELHGDLDLSIIKKEKFNNLIKLVFREGELTSLKNIPGYVKVIECPHNLLKTLVDLPGSLTHLDIRENGIKSLDLKQASELIVLHCEDNGLESISNLPKNLEELYCEKNSLKILDLEGVSKLNTLHASSNPVLIVQNKPNALINYKNDNNSLYTHDTNMSDKGATAKDILNKVDYAEALDNYFRIKQKYEIGLLNQKRKAFSKGKTKKDAIRRSMSIVPKCLNCGKSGGMSFNTTGDGYTASCGNSQNPCKFNIELTRGSYISSETYLDAMDDILNDTKQIVVNQKMDALFEYVSETTASRAFKETIKRYEEDSDLYNIEMKNFNELYNNAKRADDIKKRQVIIYNINQKIKMLTDEYKENGTTSALKVIVNIYINELMPEIENMRRLKYDIMEVIDDRLVQIEVRPSREEVNDSEEPIVKKYVSNI
jgi:DNA-binding transcriptional regulator YbjK